MPSRMETGSYISKMKRILFFIGMVAAIGCSQAQTSNQSAQTQTTQAAPQRHIDKIPAFRILTQDSVYVNNSILKAGKPVVMIYFSPDCSHCQRMMYELKPYMKDFSKAQVVMVTFSSPAIFIKLIKEFRRDFSLDSYPNFITGTEYPNYILQRYYQVSMTPFIAVYDRKGKLAKYYDKVPKDIAEFPELVKKL